MSSFTPLTFQQLFQVAATAYANAAQLPAELDELSTVGAILLAVSKAGEQLDNQVQTVNDVARIQTSSGPDLDTAVTPFGVARIGAVAATGQVTITLPSALPSAQSFPPGYIVQTASGVQYVVVSSVLSNFIGSAYVVPAGATSFTVAIECLTPGAIGNAQAGQINSTFSGVGANQTLTIQSVTNAAALTNGSDVEQDQPLRDRFTLEVASGRVGTVNAILAAIASVRTGLTYQVGEYINADGSAHAAHVTIVVDLLGSSSGPPAALLTEVGVAIDGGIYGTKVYPPVRSAGMTRSIVAPTEVPINVVANLKLAYGAVSATVIAAATAAMNVYLNNFALSVTNTPTIVSYAQIIAQLLEVSGVADLSGVTINSGVVNVSVPFGSRAVAGATTFTTS